MSNLNLISGDEMIELTTKEQEKLNYQVQEVMVECDKKISILVNKCDAVIAVIGAEGLIKSDHQAVLELMNEIYVIDPR